jgi:hypothetical protein
LFCQEGNGFDIYNLGEFQRSNLLAFREVTYLHLAYTIYAGILIRRLNVIAEMLRQEEQNDF